MYCYPVCACTSDVSNQSLGQFVSCHCFDTAVQGSKEYYSYKAKDPSAQVLPMIVAIAFYK